MTSQYHRHLEQLVGKNGSLPEQQLISRWRSELTAFLAPADRQLLNRQLGLEIGIEDTLALKLILKSRRESATLALLALAAQHSVFQTWRDHILARNLRFHCGIKLTPQGVSRELYIYPDDHQAIAELTPHPTLASAIAEVRPLFVGVDDLNGYSLYFEAREKDWVERLRTEIGLTDWHGAALWPWQQLRFKNNQMIPGKTGLELSPLPLSCLARFISHYPFPFFRHLIPMKAHTNGNFGRDPVTGRFALYAVVN